MTSNSSKWTHMVVTLALASAVSGAQIYPDWKQQVDAYDTAVCGKWKPPVEGRLGLSGMEVSQGLFPSYVKLEVRQRWGSYYCGAVLIDSDMALTTADCFKQPDITSMLAIAGYYRSDQASSQQYKSFTRVCTHENFDVFLGSNDVAVIKFDSKFEYNDNVRPVCLPPIYKPSYSFMVGLGGTNRNGAIGSSLYYRCVEQSCNEVQLRYLNSTQSCWTRSLSTRPSGLTCKADLGGPVYGMNDYGDRMYLTGLISRLDTLIDSDCSYTTFATDLSNVRGLPDLIEKCRDQY